MADVSLSTLVNNNSEDEIGHVSVDIPTFETIAESDGSHRRRILHRVPPHLREGKNYIYDPVVLSLGPYHCNLRSEQFLQVEKFKNEILIDMMDPSTKDIFCSKILERVDEIRIFYGGLSLDEYEDEALVKMMLRDACFLLYFMEAQVGDIEKEEHFVRCLGLSIAAFLPRDVLLLENQIPLWVLKLLATLKFGKNDACEKLICTSIGMTRIPWAENGHEPLHLLEIARANSIGNKDISSTIEHHGRVLKLSKWRQKGCTQHINMFENIGSGPFRSVTYLKANGIYVGPSSHCLKDIRFNSHAFYGKLLLPVCFINHNSKVYFSNVIAFEMSLETYTDFGMSAYINFMKSLLESSKDVKELREKRILYSYFNNDEEVLKVFKEIDIYGIGDFHEVHMKIDEHCNSKAKTWMAELIHTYFRSPWTAIALFAASFLLCLTFLQTYYTMSPKNNN